MSGPTAGIHMSREMTEKAILHLVDNSSEPMSKEALAVGVDLVDDMFISHVLWTMWVEGTLEFAYVDGESELRLRVADNAEAEVTT